LSSRPFSGLFLVSKMNLQMKKNRQGGKPPYS